MSPSTCPWCIEPPDHQRGKPRASPPRADPAQLPPDTERERERHSGEKTVWDAGVPGPSPVPPAHRAGASGCSYVLASFTCRFPHSSWTSSWCGTGPPTWLTTGRPPPNTCGSTRAQPSRCWRSKCGAVRLGLGPGPPSPASESPRLCLPNA